MAANRADGLRNSDTATALHGLPEAVSVLYLLKTKTGPPEECRGEPVFVFVSLLAAAFSITEVLPLRSSNFHEPDAHAAILRSVDEHAQLEADVRSALRKTGRTEARLSAYCQRRYEIAGPWTDLSMPYKRKLLEFLYRKVAELSAVKE